MSVLPIGLRTEGKRCLVIGGGAVALAKVRAVLQSNVRVVVISPDFVPEFDSLQDIKMHRREFIPADLDRIDIGIAATNDRSVNDAFARECRARGVLCNVVDKPAQSDFIMPSTLRRGAMTVSVPTAGAAPALARRLRRELESSFSADFGRYVAFLRYARDMAKQLLHDTEQRRRIAEHLASDEGQSRFLSLTDDQRDAWLSELIDQAKQPSEDPLQ